MSDITEFKFCGGNKNLLESLVRSQLYFARPENLNDPYDCQVDLTKSLERAISLATDERKVVLQQALQGRTIFGQINNDIKNFGVCSFSATLLNQALWAHYGDEHRGICLTYAIPEDFVNDPSNSIFGFSGVNYGNDRLTEFFLNYQFDNTEADLSDFAIDAMKIVLTNKSEDWKYEKEVRMIKPEPGPMKIPAEFLKQICYGLRTSERDKGFVSELVNGKYANVVFAEFQPGEANFEFRVVEI